MEGVEHVRGIVLAAGGGTRLRPLTDALPKTLLEVCEHRTILDVGLANLAAAGITDVAVVTGHAAGEISQRAGDLEARHGVDLTLIFNDRYADWNNAYSLWLARDVLADGAIVVNGDTVHPASVENALLDARGTADVVIALDDVKVLAEEEMKVRLDDHGRLTEINKALDPASVAGEYIGVTLVEADAAARLADALQVVYERDPGLYYEDGFAEHAGRGQAIATASIGDVDWVEIDDHADLERARGMPCPC